MASWFYSIVLLLLLSVYHASSHSIVRRSAGGSSWSYEGKTGPEFWPGIDQTCGGKHQSPINVDLGTTVSADFDEFTYILSGGTFKIHNNGHSVQVDVSGGKYVFSGAGLPGKEYTLVQFHWHWGSVNSQGSEHTVDGVQYSAENHFVLYDNNYPSFDAAKTQPDGIAVIAALVTVGDDDEDNPAYSPIADALSKVLNPGDEWDLAGDISVEDLLPEDLNDFARYRGSLTTPSCLETVVWTVVVDPVEVSQSQINGFRALLGYKGQPLVDNFRPTQPLNSREVQRSD